MKKNFTKNAENGISELLDFDTFWGGAASRTLLFYLVYDKSLALAMIWVITAHMSTA